MASTLSVHEPASTLDSPRPLRRTTRPASAYGLMPAELEAKLVEIGEPAFRGRQIASWLYDTERLAADYGEMTDLPAKLRTRLAETLPISTLETVRDLQTETATPSKRSTRPSTASLSKRC